MRLMEVMTMEKRTWNLKSYSVPTWRPAISDRHRKVMFRKSGVSKN